jgi:capsular polysaccharide biosynthesis protein
MRRRRRYPSVRLTGRVALLGACWAGGSFAHFSSDALPRWKLIEEAGFHLRDFNHVLAYDPRTRSSEVLLATLKLAPKLIRAQALCDYTCDELVFTSHPHFTPRYTPDLLRFVRELLPARSGERRVYLSRSGYARHPSNAAALEALLARKGFETVPADDHLAALHACQEASIVLGVEGSNLYNTIFCRPGSRVILLLWQGCPFSYIAGIGAALGHHTSIVPATAGSSDAAPHFALEAVEAAVTEAIQAAA